MHMPTETNVYSRNLKVISIFFIIYWLLGLHPQENILALGPVRFTIDDPHWLPYIANSLLVYFAWRFYIHSRKRVSSSYSRFFRQEFISKKHPHWNKKLLESATNDFTNNGKFEEFQKKNTGAFFDKLTPEQCEVNIPSLQNSNPSSPFTYKYVVSIPKNVRGRPPAIKGGGFTFKFNIILRLALNIHLFTLWLVSEEDSADYLIPWIFFVVALVSIILRYEGHSATTLIPQCPQPTGGYPVGWA